MAEPHQEQPAGNVRPMSREELATIERTENLGASQYEPSRHPGTTREESREFTGEELEKLEAAALHEQRVDDIINLLRAEYQAEGRHLDAAFYDEMRGLYRRRSDDRLRKEIERLRERVAKK